jgi:polyphosphate kinase 2 (PPK2 family)
MGKKSNKTAESEQRSAARRTLRSVGDGGADGKMKRKAYEAELSRLQGELVAMQEWVKVSGAKICIVF